MANHALMVYGCIPVCVLAHKPMELKMVYYTLSPHNTHTVVPNHRPITVSDECFDRYVRAGIVEVAPAKTPYTNAYVTDDGRLMVEVGRGSFVAEAVAIRFGFAPMNLRRSAEAKAARLPARVLRRQLARETKARAVLTALLRSL